MFLDTSLLDILSTKPGESALIWFICQLKSLMIDTQ